MNEENWNIMCVVHKSLFGDEVVALKCENYISICCCLLYYSIASVRRYDLSILFLADPIKFIEICYRHSMQYALVCNVYWQMLTHLTALLNVERREKKTHKLYTWKTNLDIDSDKSYIHFGIIFSVTRFHFSFFFYSCYVHWLHTILNDYYLQ